MQAFVIYQDGTLGSRKQARSLLTSAGHRRAVRSCRRGIHGAPGPDPRSGDVRRPPACGGARFADLDIGERAALPWRYTGYVYLGLAAHWRGNAERAEAELRTAVELEPPSAIGGQSVSLLAQHLAFQGRAEEVLHSSSRPGRRCPASARPAASARGTACSASLRRSTCVASTRKRRRCPRLSKACSRA